MKVLRITAQGLPLFKEPLDVNFCAQQRVPEQQRESLRQIFSHVFLNQICGFIGLNASGKTSVLKALLLALGLLNNDPINHMPVKDILGNTKKTSLSIYFYSETQKEICLLETAITSDTGINGATVYRILSETLKTKKPNSGITRINLFDFTNIKPSIERRGNEEFLPEDVSIMIARNKKTRETSLVSNLLLLTNTNILESPEKIAPEVISFLDPTIEKLYFEEHDQKILIHLKFVDQDEIRLNSFTDLNYYLSSGTIKGIITFTKAREILNYGGYLVIDELENHFNKEIVSTLMRFFMDSGVNKKGGTLIFSTHYPELLDVFERNDCAYITRNNNGLTVENLVNLLNRNDIKRSDAFQSGFLSGTTPSYEAYLKLKKAFSNEKA